LTALLRLAASDGWRAALNVALYQAGWFACVLGAANGLPWVGVVAAVGIVAWHLATAPRPGPEAALIGAALVVGALFETLVVRAGWARYPSQSFVDGAAPVWMIALWAMFATMLNVTLRALRDRPALAAVLGAIGGPLAYYAGARLGAIVFPDLAAALVAIGIGWAVLAPALLWLARRLDGFAAAPS
jgi:hypothetical protein